MVVHPERSPGIHGHDKWITAIILLRPKKGRCATSPGTSGWEAPAARRTWGAAPPCAPRLLRACPVVRHASNGKAGTPGQDPQDVPAFSLERETGFEPATLSLGS